MKPVAYESTGGQWIQHPDLKLYVEKDIFVAVAPRAMVDPDGSNEITITRGDSVLLGEGRFSLRFDAFDTELDLAAAVGAEEAGRTQIAVGARLRLTDLAADSFEELRPVYAVRNDRSVHVLPARTSALTVYFTGMDVDNHAVQLSLEGIDGPDYVVVQAYEKPAISLVWIGLILLSGGFLLSAVRRAGELRFRYRRSATRSSAPDELPG